MITSPGKASILEIGAARFTDGHWDISGWVMDVSSMDPSSPGWTPEELRAIAEAA